MIGIEAGSSAGWGTKMRLTLPILALATTTAAIANDTTASTGAGGLQILRTDAIDMVSEDLFISAEQIQVRYLFRNRTAADVEAIVAFPMPDRDLSQEYGGDVAYPSGFRTRVNGDLVHSTLERRAILYTMERCCVDYRQLLEELHIPVAPESINDAVKVMDRLSLQQRRRLIQLGLAGEEEWDDDGKGMKKHLIPLWTVQDKWWWRQRFPRSQTVRIEHTYVPGVGGSADTPLRYTRDGHTDDARWATNRYCVDKAFMAGFDRAQRRKPEIVMPDQRIDYILTTGANWRSPISDFRLIVDKGKATNLVSFCGKGVRKISPTRFEVRYRNWRPSQDLHVLIVDPQGDP